MANASTKIPVNVFNDGMIFLRFRPLFGGMMNAIMHRVPRQTKNAKAAYVPPRLEMERAFEEELQRAVGYIRDHWQRRYGLAQVG
jgi:hypothetical protein